ncbi:MAG: winged helix-turn-helix transcriptional regulator [Anaerolineales bacterium]|nr:winged helix-turn-helix transcriptional regulator [Anaerolineales bacterium]
MTMNSQVEQDLRILEHIEQDPDITQADLAARLGVAVGSVNWYLKRLVNKGYIKVRQMQRRRLRYLITPQGVAEKARLTASFMQVSMRLYRETREAAKRYLTEIRQAGYGEVHIEGDNDLAEVCYLTCLEQGVQVVDASQHSIPTLRVEGMETLLVWPEREAPRTTGTREPAASVQIQVAGE